MDGFWSVSVYNADGYFEPNERNAYSVNNITATRMRRVDHRQLRRMRRRPAQLPTDHGWLELRRPAVPATTPRSSTVLGRSRPPYLPDERGSTGTA